MDTSAAILATLQELTGDETMGAVQWQTDRVEAESEKSSTQLLHREKESRNRKQFLGWMNTKRVQQDLADKGAGKGNGGNARVERAGWEGCASTSHGKYYVRREGCVSIPH